MENFTLLTVKKGNYVRIKDDLGLTHISVKNPRDKHLNVCDKKVRCYGVTSDMLQYAGEFTEVISIVDREATIRLAIDGGEHKWSACMLDPVTLKEKKDVKRNS